MRSLVAAGVQPTRVDHFLSIVSMGIVTSNFGFQDINGRQDGAHGDTFLEGGRGRDVVVKFQIQGDAIGIFLGHGNSGLIIFGWVSWMVEIEKVPTPEKIHLQLQFPCQTLLDASSEHCCSQRPSALLMSPSGVHRIIAAAGDGVMVSN